jgi:hypothetical protein
LSNPFVRACADHSAAERVVILFLLEEPVWAAAAPVPHAASSNVCAANTTAFV